MFEEFYEIYEPEEQEVVALINRCIGGGFNWKGNFWEMTVVTLGIVFCDTGKVSTKEERLEWPVTDEERNSEKGWERFQNEQICRLKIRRMKEEWAKDLVTWPWCISQVVKAHEDCPELQAVLDEYHKPVVIQDQVLGELKLDKDYDTFEGEIQWCGKDVLLSLEVNAESKPSWTRARSAAKKLLADCETWDKAMRELAAKNLTELANNWLSQDEENPRDPETDPITEEELARRISMTSLSVTSGGSFTAWFDCDEMFTDHAVTVYGSLKKGLKTANIEKGAIPMKAFDPNYKLLDEMYQDDYYPAFLVDKVKDELQKVIDLLENGETDTEVVQETLDEAVCGINDLQDEFYENDSEIETVARDCIGVTVDYILKWFGIPIDMEEAIRERDW